MISEIQLNTLDNKPVKVNKKDPPRSINPDLTPLYFTAVFIGSKNSGKTYGLVKMLKNYESQPIKNSDGDTLPMRTILFCPTASSMANPIYSTLKSLCEEDMILNYSMMYYLIKLRISQKKKNKLKSLIYIVNSLKSL